MMMGREVSGRPLDRAFRLIYSLALTLGALIKMDLPDLLTHETSWYPRLRERERGFGDGREVWNVRNIQRELGRTRLSEGCLGPLDLSKSISTNPLSTPPLSSDFAVVRLAQFA